MQGLLLLWEARLLTQEWHFSWNHFKAYKPVVVTAVGPASPVPCSVIAEGRPVCVLIPV